MCGKVNIIQEKQYKKYNYRFYEYRNKEVSYKFIDLSSCVKRVKYFIVILLIDAHTQYEDTINFKAHTKKIWLRIYFQIPSQLSIESILSFLIGCTK